MVFYVAVCSSRCLGSSSARLRDALAQSKFNIVSSHPQGIPELDTALRMGVMNIAVKKYFNFLKRAVTSKIKKKMFFHFIANCWKKVPDRVGD